MVHDSVWGKISTLNEIYQRRLKPKPTPNFSNRGPVTLRDTPMLATKLGLLVFAHGRVNDPMAKLQFLRAEWDGVGWG